MKRTAVLFKEFYEASFNRGADQSMDKKNGEGFFADFVYYTPIKLKLLESYLNDGKIDFFYNSLPDLKYLVEFSDNLNRYWHLLRAYSGALAKLTVNRSTKGAIRLYSYYFEKYGDRRTIRNEHWFEKKRWEFLDELHAIYNEDELETFILKYQRILVDSLEIYVSFVLAFINDLKKLQPSEIPVKELKAS
jgi:hypothetical protein